MTVISYPMKASTIILLWKNLAPTSIQIQVPAELIGELPN